MTKISFDVDFSKDPDQILKEIQERAKAEVEKRESKERSAAYLSNLHESVNDKIGTEFKSVSDLIRALTPFAAPSLRDKLSGTTSTGRRKTLSMNKDIYEDIKKLLAEPNSNKAAIARETGASVVQVRKVAEGGFDSKYSGELSSSSEMPAPVLDSPVFAPPPVLDEPSADEGVMDEIPSPPTSEESETKTENSAPIEEDAVPENTEEDSPSAIPSASFGEDDSAKPLAPPPIPMDIPPSALADLPTTSDESESEEDTSGEILPPLPKFTPAPFVSDENDSEEKESDNPVPLPSFGDEEEDSPLPPPAVPPPTPMEEDEEDNTESKDILPPLPKFTPAPFDSEQEDSDRTEESAPPPLPSFGQENEKEDSPLPSPAPLSVDPPPMPDLPPPVQSVEETEESPEEIPPSPEEGNSFPPTPPSMASNPPSAGLTRPPSGLKPTLKPKLGGGKKGKPTLSLKPKSKTTGLKITRPPMKGTPPPSQ
jgi:hypothetical protein